MLAKAGVFPELRVHFCDARHMISSFQKGREYTFVVKTLFCLVFYGIALIGFKPQTISNKIHDISESQGKA